MLKNKKIAVCLALSFLLAFSVGCADKDQKNVIKSTIKTQETVNSSAPNEVKDENKDKEESKDSAATATTNNQGENIASVAGNEEKEPIAAEDKRSLEMNLLNIRHSAESGTLINLKFAAGKNNIYDVEKDWGNADSSDYVDDAKGTYSTYSDKHIVFGWNKGGTLFEIRSTSPLSSTPYYYVEEVLGNPDYTADVNGERIIGYKLNDDYKLLFVFEGNSINAKVDHYSVLNPASTVNSMANDPGREW